MSDWPDSLKVQPIHEWPGKLNADRRRAQFRSPSKVVDGRRIPAKPIPLSQTLVELNRELEMLGAKNVLLQVAIPRVQFHLDGRPRAGAIPQHPGIILTMDTEVGPLSYPCDTFTTWQDNLRAITLALEALRLVDRYGVAKRGDQYRGYLAIESATAMPAGIRSVDEAREVLRAASGFGDDVQVWDRTLVRAALRYSHPDNGGDADQFQRVILAEQYLKKNGAL